MRLFALAGSFKLLLLMLSLLSSGTVACRKAADLSNLGTFRMGDIVRAGPITYQVIEARWAPDIPGFSRRPNDRFLLVHASITNSSSKPIGVPAFSLVAPNGKSYSEITEGMAEAPNWLGMLRNLEPNQKLEGFAYFDAPIGAYKLAVSDAGEVGSEKYGHIEIPADLG